MPIDKVTAAQYYTQMQAAILSRNKEIDTASGPVPDGALNPQSIVLEQQNDRTRLLSLLLALANVDQLTGVDADIEGIVANEGLFRILGTQSSTTAVFSRASLPTTDIVVQRGYPIASQPDEATGATITFVTTETLTLPAASASSYFNIQTQRYELSVPIISVAEGSTTRVGPNRVNRALRPLAGFDSVTNPTGATGGLDRETNVQLVARYLLAILGRQIGTPAGVERAALADFPEVRDIFLVYGADALLTRAATDAGAVDAWVQGTTELQAADNLPFLGVGQVLAVTLPPMISVVSVSSGANTYIEGSDFEAVFDDSGVSRSPRAVDGIRFLPGGPTTLPAIGATVTITYTYDNLARALQSDFTQPDTLALGTDLLWRRGIATPIVLTAQLRVLTGFSPSTILALVNLALLAFVNVLGEGDAVEGSDLQGVVRAISGVDNFIITRLTRATVLSGTSDVTLGGNEYATLASADLSITPV